ADEDILIVGAVEDADEPRRRQLLADAPQEVVLQLLRGRLLEGGDAHPLRVDLADHMAHDAALAGGVHALQHQQHAAPVTTTTSGEEPLLQLRQLLAAALQGLLSSLLPAPETRSGRRIEIRQLEA